MTNSSITRWRMVGDRPEPVPAQSAFGWVVRLARLNQFSPGDFHRMLGIRVARADDLSRTLALSMRRQDALAEALGIARPDCWSLGAWHPFEGAPAGFEISEFRYCLGCIRVGYHTLLHQMPWIGHCPWHGVRLRSGCPRCGGALAVSSAVGRKLLSCVCGCDLVNESAAAQLAAPLPGAALALEQYFSWASAERRVCRLVGSSDVPLGGQLLGLLVQPPFGGANSSVRAAEPVSPSRRYRASGRTGRGNDPRLASLKVDCPQLLELPEDWVTPARLVARGLAMKLPAGSLTPVEHAVFLGVSLEELGPTESAGRPTSGTVRCLPPIAVGSRRFLDLSAVHPVVVRVVARLDDGLANSEAPPDRTELPDPGMGRAPTRDLMLRGYAEGLRTVLSRYVPKLYELGRDRPHLSAAWALVRRGDRSEVRVAFARVDAHQAPPDALTAALARVRR